MEALVPDKNAPKRCAIMQPTYLPWLGYFDLIRSVDAFVIYDHVQFEKQSWQQRNYIRDKNGKLLLVASVLHESGLERKIKDVKLDHSRNFLKKHLTSIQLSYSKTTNFKEIYPRVAAIYDSKPALLMHLNTELIKLAMEYLGIQTELIYSSDLEVQGQKVEALIDVCKKVSAGYYLSPVGSKAYIDENNLFPENEIELSYQNFTHPEYQQIHNKEFISHLSFVDYLFNIDLAEAKLFGSFKTPY